MSVAREAVVPLAGPPKPHYTKLRPGRCMAAEDVATHQKARLHSAMIELAGASDRGYASVKIGELTRLAGVSSRSFYEHFDGKQACFLKAHELVVRRTAKRVIASQAGERDWEERLRLAFRAFARELEREPLAARLALVEAHAAGPAAKEQTRWAERSFAAMLNESFERSGEKSELPSLFSLGLVGGITCVARSQVLWEDPSTAELGDELTDWVLSCFRELRAEERLGDEEPRLIPPLAGGEHGDEPRSSMSNRDLILSATFKLVGEDMGGAPLSLGRICAAAGVSRKTFETHFDCLEDCLIAAAEARADEAFARAALAQASGGSWEEGVQLAMTSLCDRFARDRVLSKLCFVETAELGRPGLHCWERLMAEISDLICCNAPNGQCTDDLATEASAGAIWGIMSEMVAADHRQQLPRIAPMLTSLAIAPSRQRLLGRQPA